MEPLSIPRGSIYFKQKKKCQTRKQIIEKSQEVEDVAFRSPLGQDLNEPYGKGHDRKLSEQQWHLPDRVRSLLVLVD